MSSKLSDRVERLEKRCDVQLQQLSDLQSSHHRLAESVRRLEAEVYTDAEVPDAPAPKPPPVAPDHELVKAWERHRHLIASLRAIYNLGREHGAAQPCPYIRSSDEGTSYCALAEQEANR